MQPAAFTSLIISTHRLDLRALETSDLPVFLGSTLRGAFGHALKEAVCVMEHRDCARCLVAERCLYPYLFETPPPPGLSLLSGQQQAPRPFILAPPVIDLPARSGGDLAAASPELAREGEPANGYATALPRPRALRQTDTRRLLVAGDQLSFDLLLVGRAVEALPYVIHAISRLAARGLGVARARFELSSVIACDERGATRVIFTGRSPRLAPPEGAAKSLADFVCARLAQLSPRASLRLRFLTPTRIRVEGGLQAELSFPLLVRNLLRRVSLLMATHAAGQRGQVFPQVVPTGQDSVILISRIAHGASYYWHAQDETFFRAYRQTLEAAPYPVHLRQEWTRLPEPIPDPSKYERRVFALGLAYEFIAVRGASYYLDPERRYTLVNTTRQASPDWKTIPLLEAGAIPGDPQPPAPPSAADSPIRHQLEVEQAELEEVATELKICYGAEVGEMKDF